MCRECACKSYPFGFVNANVLKAHIVQYSDLKRGAKGSLSGPGRLGLAVWPVGDWVAARLNTIISMFQLLPPLDLDRSLS